MRPLRFVDSVESASKGLPSTTPELDRLRRLRAERVQVAEEEEPHALATGRENIVFTLGTITCFSCWGSDFWQGTGALVCRRCHPPALGAEVLTLSGTGSDASGPVQMNAGSMAATPETRTNGVRGGAA